MKVTFSLFAHRLPARLPTTLNRPFRILALESSADDSCASIVDSDRNVLSNVVVKQHLIHGMFYIVLMEPSLETESARSLDLCLCREIRRDTPDKEPRCTRQEHRKYTAREHAEQRSFCRLKTWSEMPMMGCSSDEFETFPNLSLRWCAHWNGCMEGVISMTSLLEIHRSFIQPTHRHARAPVYPIYMSFCIMTIETLTLIPFLLFLCIV
jgi:hypothetical protein